MSTIGEKLWHRAPVVEVVFGVQFQPLEGFSNAHLGMYWGMVNTDYPHPEDAVPIGLLDPAELVTGPTYENPSIMLGQTVKGRLQMRSQDKQFMLQLQNGWLTANWLRAGSHSLYPGSDVMLSRFKAALSKLLVFLEQQKLGSFIGTMWDVTYIDHFPRETVWSAYSDLPGVVPGLLGPACTNEAQFESVHATWGLKLLNIPGRLNVTLTSARQNVDAVEILQFRSIARGPIADSSENAIVDQLSLGKKALVDTFKAVTSPNARSYWEGS
ncbi:MAG: TIGR04255 family protein [Phycisphaerales bacterium]|nr:TIGR04255 family protein [Phycisphaerales bacterium]